MNDEEIKKPVASKKATEKRRPKYPLKVVVRLWTLSGGRCQFAGHNKVLWRHSFTMAKMNYSYIAHIYAFSKNGPRYDPVLSPQLEKDLSNLMLVCDECHTSFDDTELAKTTYTADVLIEMKREHERRIELVTGILESKKSHMVLYGARVGSHESVLNFESTAAAMIPERYPSSDHPIQIGIQYLSLTDNDPSYWENQERNLLDGFQKYVAMYVGRDPVQHFSIFALAPQPLLIKLGTLLGELRDVDVYQLHRDPQSWKWREDSEVAGFKVIEPSGRHGKVALVFSLSATISNERIYSVLGSDCSIYKITIESPYNNFLRSKGLLDQFKRVTRGVLDRIKLEHGEKAVLNVFPAMPVSASVEFGRIWMPKADLPMVIYDQSPSTREFVKTIEINNSKYE